jgi:protein-tyrosine-phosphatase
MAAGYLNHLSGGRIEVRSAGSEPADKINPVVVQAMAEEGIDIAAEQPKILTTEAVKACDVVTGSSTTLPARASRSSDRFATRLSGGLSN